jgi:hypothetical protein
MAIKLLNQPANWQLIIKHALRISNDLLLFIITAKAAIIIIIILFTSKNRNKDNVSEAVHRNREPYLVSFSCKWMA